ncbi:ribonuclease E inhibitor RraB [Gayadomonas joobiniege]|uniref:ribonuclease E inhibitor RraB n=1 Tax=Gayadomonas joobiniege TaxID=1234606 RepID=UPI0003820CA8|nr:ribonuclease E inhibitor RraB [Gayadomonas joobiniege]
MFILPPETDETAEILAEMEAEGIDLSQPVKIDFFAVFEFKEQAEKALPKIKSFTLGNYKFSSVVLQKPEQGGGYEVIASLTMLAQKDALDELDQAFTACVEGVKGYSDGWGIGL